MEKEPFFHRVLFLAVFIIAFLYGIKGQQKFTQVSSKENSYCNSTCTLIDIPELNNNINAVILATPFIENGINPNPHPIGVHYIKDKWSIINLDQASMPTGSKFDVQYFAKPDPDYQFVHSVTKESLQENNTRSFINNKVLNGNSEANLQFMASGIGIGNNRDEINLQYDNGSGQWFIYKTNKKPFDYGVTYNIVIKSKGNTIETPAAVSQPAATTQSVLFGGRVKQILISIESAQQGKFKSDGLANIPTNKIELTSFNFESSISLGTAAGQASARINKPISVTKLFGPASLRCYKAYLNNEILSNVTIEFYEMGKSGPYQLVNTIKLTNARVVGFVQNVSIGESAINGEKGLIDEIKITYQKIEMTDASGFTTSYNVTQN